jgi:hypothetical protein
MRDTDAGRAAQLADRGFYRITVKGCLDDSWSAWFDGLTVTSDCEHVETVLAGEVRDQAELHGLLAKLAVLGLPLMAVNREADQG